MEDTSFIALLFAKKLGQGHIQVHTWILIYWLLIYSISRLTEFQIKFEHDHENHGHIRLPCCLSFLRFH